MCVLNALNEVQVGLFAELQCRGVIFEKGMEGRELDHDPRTKLEFAGSFGLGSVAIWALLRLNLHDLRTFKIEQGSI